MSLLQQVKSNFGLSDLFGIVGVFGGIFLLNFIFGFFFTVFAISLFSFAFFYLGFGVVDTKASSTVAGDARAGEGAPRALTGIKKLKDYPIEGVTTLYESFLNGCKVNGDGKCIGIRKDDNEFTWRTYKEVRTQLTNIASSFIHLGLPEGDRVGIYSRNCAEWILAAEACSFSNLVSVAIYDTLGEENRVFVVQQSRIRVLFFFSNLYKNVIDLKHSDCETLKYAVVMDNVLTDAQREEAESVGLTIYTFSEFEKIGKDHPHDPRPPKPQDLAILMYTSGTTSRPKGVMITHGNMMSTVAGITDAINVTKEDAFLSFLPLAHILERAAESALLCHGAAIGYYQGDIRKLTSDVQKLKPTVYAGVPKVYQRVMNEIKKNIYSQPPSKQRLFEILFSVKKHALRTGLTTVVKILDVILFQKIKDALGGRVRVIVSGGAPLGGECHEFLKVCFSCPFVQGYGLTETCGAASISPLDLANPYEKSGLPMTCTNIKLVDSGKYSSAHNPPQGEVCITGPNITLGYYENEEKTAEVYKRDESGTVWFHTGDAGQWNPDGTLSIIGRTKDIFKLDGGEYIAPERLETIYAPSTFVSNIFIYGDSKRSEIVAIVVPEFSQAIDWAKKNGIEVKEAFAPPNCPPSLCSNKAFKQAIVDDFKSVAASARLQAFEALRLIQLDPLFWTPETQLVTSALKNKRPELYGKFEKELEALYK